MLIALGVEDSYCARHTMRSSGIAFLICLLWVSVAQCAELAQVLGLLVEEPGNRKALLELRGHIATEKDSDEKARLSVIYILGCEYGGERDEAARARAYLAKAHAGNPWRPYAGLKTISGPCPTCLGLGQMEADCPKCGGTGQCHVCDGKGLGKIQGFTGRGPRKCLTCEGTGKCSTCKGKKKIQQRCPACKGMKTCPLQHKIKSVMVTVLSGALPEGNPDSASTGIVALREMIRHLARLPKVKAEAETTEKMKLATRLHVKPIPGMADGRSITLTSRVKDIAMDPGGHTATIVTEGFTELQKLIVPSSRLIVSRTGTVRVRMARPDVLRVSPGDPIEIVGRLRVTPGSAASTSQKVVHFSFHGGDPDYQVSAWMTDYSCKVGDRRYLSPYAKLGK